jgi:F-type H+-transporting ATPase subunit epsilon
MKTLNLEVITPSKAAYTGMVKSVTVPGSSGSFQILYNHAPILSSLDVGIVKIQEDSGEEKIFAAGGGTVEVLNNKVLILAESFETPEEIDVRRAEEAMKRAKKRLSKEAEEEKVDFTRAEISLKRAINRLKITDSYKPL